MSEISYLWIDKENKIRESNEPPVDINEGKQISYYRAYQLLKRNLAPLKHGNKSPIVGHGGQDG